MYRTWDNERKNSYNHLDVDPAMMDTLEKMSVEDRKTLFYLSSGCMGHNKNAIKTFETIFPTVKKSILNYWLLMTLCRDDFTTAELEHQSYIYERQLKALPQGIPDDNTIDRLERQCASVVAALRLQQHMTQKKLAELSGINIRQIQKIESLEIKLQNISAGNIKKIAEALNTTMEYLLEEQTGKRE